MNHEYQISYKTKSKLLSIQAEYYGIVKNRNIIPGCETRKGLAIYNGQIWKMYLENEEYASCQNIGEKIIYDKKKLHEYIVSAKSKIEEYNKLVKIYEEGKVKSQSDYFKQVFAKYSDCLAVYRFTNKEYSSKYERMIEDIQKRKGISNSEMQSLLNQELEDLEVYREKQDWMRILSFCDEKIVRDLIKEHVNKYMYLFGSDLYDTESICNVFWKKYKKENIIEKANIKIELIDNYRINLAETERDLIENIKVLSKLRLQIRENFMKCNFILRDFYKEILNEISNRYSTKLDFSFFRLLSYEDIVNFFCENEISISNITSRSEGMYCQLDDECVNIWTTVDKKFNDERHSDSSKQSNVIVGKNASIDAIIEGTVVCLEKGYTVEDIDLEKIKNSIIVVTTLHPDIVMLDTGIAGIISDEGGILSHASIIAREMQIPCITDTYYSTKLLQTGDIVRIDSASGTIEIIEKYAKGVSETANSKNYCCLFEERDISEFNIGNKAQNLYKHRNNFPILNGICLTQEFCMKLVGWDEMLAKVNKHIGNDEISDKVIYLIIGIVKEHIDYKRKQIVIDKELSTMMEEFYPAIVRSSSIEEDSENASFAGMLESIENVQKESEAINAICDVILSNFSYASIKYRIKQGYDVLPSCTAVLIQRYVDYRYKATIFTNDPVNLNSNVIVVEMVKKYDNKKISQNKQIIYINKNTNEIIEVERDANMDLNDDNNIGSQVIWLNQVQLKEMLDIVDGLETIWKTDLDIEWCMDKEGRQYLLQCRPITTC